MFTLAAMFVYTTSDIALAILLLIVVIVGIGLGVIAGLAAVARALRKFWK